MVREISPVGKEVYGGNDLVKSQVLSSEWKTELVKDASGDREDGKEDDDDMPCVIGESEGDCVWRGCRPTSSKRRHGDIVWVTSSCIHEAYIRRHLHQSSRLAQPAS